jgi:hypothetical protein
MQNEDSFLFVTVDNAARRLADLSIAPTSQFWHFWTAQWVIYQLIDMLENTPNQL